MDRTVFLTQRTLYFLIKRETWCVESSHSINLPEFVDTADLFLLIKCLYEGTHYSIALSECSSLSLPHPGQLITSGRHITLSPRGRQILVGSLFKLIPSIPHDDYIQPRDRLVILRNLFPSVVTDSPYLKFWLSPYLNISIPYTKLSRLAEVAEETLENLREAKRGDSLSLCLRGERIEITVYEPLSYLKHQDTSLWLPKSALFSALEELYTQAKRYTLHGTLPETQLKDLSAYLPVEAIEIWKRIESGWKDEWDEAM